MLPPLHKARKEAEAKGASASFRALCKHNQIQINKIDEMVKYDDGLGFNRITNPEQKVWRYMDFAKFIDLLDSEELYFTRPDRFEDKFEGSLSHEAWEMLRLNQGEAEVTNRVNALKNSAYKHLRISCWHMNDSESIAMWKLYLTANDGVAIQTTFKKLESVLQMLPYEFMLYPVSYVNYDVNFQNADNMLKPFYFKRNGFVHESELRAITFINTTKVEKIIDDGLKIKVPLTELIENVYVSPHAPFWLLDLITRISNERFGIELNILKSRLSELPPYSRGE